MSDPATMTHTGAAGTTSDEDRVIRLRFMEIFAAFRHQAEAADVPAFFIYAAAYDIADTILEIAATHASRQLCRRQRRCIARPWRWRQCSGRWQQPHDLAATAVAARPGRSQSGTRRRQDDAELSCHPTKR